MNSRKFNSVSKKIFEGFREIGAASIFSSKMIQNPDMYVLGGVELAKRTAAALCALLTLKRFHFIVVVYFS